MADPLSMAASIAGIIALGITVNSGIHQVISDAMSSDSLLFAISNDLRLLIDILGKIDALTSEWRQEDADPLLPSILAGCRESLEELQATVETVQDTFARGGLKKRWLQAIWSSKKKEIAAISVKISDYKSTLTLTLQMQNA